MSMQRVVSFSLDDLVVDSDGVIETLNNACTHRHDHYRVSGICQLENKIYFVLLPLDSGEKMRDYIMVPAEDVSHDGFVDMLHTRWSSGFDLIGSVQLYETTMVLFAKPVK